MCGQASTTLDKEMGQILGLADSALPEIGRANQIAHTCISRGKNGCSTRASASRALDNSLI